MGRQGDYPQPGVPLPRSVTRRGLFKTAAATGVAGLTVGVLSSCNSQGDTTRQPTVVDSGQADYVIDPTTNESNFESVDLPLTDEKSYELPVGVVLLPGDEDWIPATSAGSSAYPMVKASAFSVSSGKLVDVVEEPRSKDQVTTVIYDVCCSNDAFAWVELNLITRSWVLYASSFKKGELTGEVSTLWKADANYDPPSLAVSGKKVIWLVMPSTTGESTEESSYAYLWEAGADDATVVVESPGRFATDPAVSDGVVTLTPRVRADEGVYYGATAYSLDDDLSSVVDQLVLPQTVKPLNATRIGDVFAVSIEASYSTGGLLGEMGTYIGTSDGSFVALSREPSAPVSGKDGLFVVKSQASYFVVNTEDRTYAVLQAVNRAVDYGEYPARAGTCDTFVTYATVKDQDTGIPASVTVRTFKV